MPEQGAVVVVGGTRAIGFEIVKHYLGKGHDVWLTGRHSDHVAEAVAATDGKAHGLTFDLSEPEAIASALSDVGPVEHLVLAAVERDSNTVKDYDIARALRLVTLKLVGYPEVVHALFDRLTDDASVLVFGGMAKERPYPGSTTVTTINGGVVGLTRTLVEELQPRRVNALHPGFVSDTPYWAGKTEFLEAKRVQTPCGRLPTIEDIVDASVFLLENRAVNGVDLIVDGGWHCR
jgi:NAD(P)-dependent dehydrogenase (short-subunit alcohol dehydrogenase family)